jgi:ribokinase
VSPGAASVCVVGSLHFDIMVRAPYLPRTGETLIGEAWWWKPGGKGANQAMAAARHGASVRMVGCLGDDGFGERLRERLAAAGVDHTAVRTVAQGSGMSVAIQQADGDYAAIVVSGANLELGEAHIMDSAVAIRDSRVLVLQNEIAAESDRAAAVIARDAGGVVILNAAPSRPMGELTGLVDVLVVNAVEAEMLGGGPVESLTGALEAAAALRMLAPSVVVTAGAAGVAAVSGETTWMIAANEVAGAQTHGAGDVFVGALAARLAGDQPMEPALRYANAAAAVHVSAASPEGATPGAGAALPGPVDVRRLLRSR